jgi:hypothetical protein
MRLPRFGVLAAALAAAVSWPAAASADGPFEPNETAAMATTPLTAPRFDAGLETPQDEDWYLLLPQGVRQIGILATLQTQCSKSYGRISLDLLDAEGSSLPVATLQLGYDIWNARTPKTADTAAFTSVVGHRYLLHVTQSGCDSAGYTLQLAPDGALGTRLAPTKACTDANIVATRARVKLRQLRAARRRARGVRRKALAVRIALQSQQVLTTAAAARGTCTRPPLSGYPWE